MSNPTPATSTFEVYVYDDEPPILACPGQLEVCTDGEETSDELYATISTDGYATTTTSGTGRYTGAAPRLYVQSVKDNVDADMEFASTDYTRSGDASTDYVVTHSRCDSSDTDCVDTTPYTLPPRVSDISTFVSATSDTAGPTNWRDSITRPRYRIGNHKITFTAEDSFGNTATCDVSVIVRDCAPPKPVCTPVSANTEVDVCYCTVHGLTVVAADNSGIEPRVLLTVNGIPVDDDFKFAIGETEVVAKAIDMSGAVPCKHNAALNSIAACYPADHTGLHAASGAESDELSETCTLTVTCVDNQNPVLNCPAVHRGSCNSQEVLADGSTYGTIGDGISWPPQITASDNSGITIPGTYRVMTGDHAATEVTADTRFYWYEAVQVRYTATDETGLSGECTFTVEIACTIEKWARGTDFDEISTCGSTSVGDQMTCLSAGVGGGAADADGFVELTATALQMAATGAARPPQPRTTSMAATMSGGDGSLGFDMYWAPEARVISVPRLTVPRLSPPPPPPHCCSTRLSSGQLGTNSV